ncbi:hypothetical protein QFC21_004717 [Naganishia friedmannii]|uniref:Uncharacterized protein n=1 Tax=Naganishia friedmannii TaxID=89922 RepID=A0ACC2VFH3_9TREE|nr:hypothetical protein QFC21_004717 [Naganishia friedmannii]
MAEPPGQTPPTTTKTCSLVGPVALIVQALMALLVIASLLVKREYEGGPRRDGGPVVPRRKWKVWLFDVSKQLIGQTLIHASNLLTLNHLLHFNLTPVHGTSPNSWAKQLGVYLAALLVMKIFVLVLFAFALDPVLLPLAGWILDWMRAWSQIVFVMAVFPLFMNIIQFCLIDSLIKGREVGSDDAGDSEYHYTAASTIVPKDIEQGLVSSSYEHPEETHDSSSSNASVPPLNHTERGRGKSRESSRASSRFRGAGGGGAGGSRTPRSTTGSRTGSRGLTPIPTYSASPSNAEHNSLKPKPRSGAMQRTRSNDGYGSTGSTEPSPAFRGLTLRDAMEDDGEVFALGGDDPPRNDKRADTADAEEHNAVDPDATPRPDTGGTFQPAPSVVAPKRINDDVRIQARRSLSSEGSHIVRRSHHRSKRNDHHKGNSTVTTLESDAEAEGENVVLLNDV